MGALDADQSLTGFASGSRLDIPNSLQTAALNVKLRQQLVSKHKKSDVVLESLSNSDAREIAVSAMSKILKQDTLNRSELHHVLMQLFESFSVVYQQADIPSALRKRQFISKHGLVISPDNNITSILDVLRVRAFTRGVDKAIQQFIERHPENGPLHIVYPACGPFAPLLLPLLMYYQDCGRYTPNDLRVTLIDMQQGAVMSLQVLVDVFEVSEYIDEIRCQDAMSFQCDRPIHIVLLEAMQHGFSREGQLSLARHFATLLEPDGFMVPQKVSVRASLNIGQREFVDQWKARQQCEFSLMDEEVVAERTDLGEVLSVTLESLRELKIEVLDEYTSLVECASIVIPDNIEHADQQLLLLCSCVQVFESEWLGEYDSGITHPLPDEQVCINFIPSRLRPGDLLVKSGDRLKFYYRLNALPGFFASCDDQLS